MLGNHLRAFVAFTATLFASNAALADYHVDILPPVTPVSIDIYNLHWGILWVCVVIFVIVFGATFWSIRSGPRKLDSSISVISARRGDGIARLPGETRVAKRSRRKPNPVLTPVLGAKYQFEFLPEERMIRMGYPETSALIVASRRN